MTHISLWVSPLRSEAAVIISAGNLQTSKLRSVNYFSNNLIQNETQWIAHKSILLD